MRQVRVMAGLTWREAMRRRILLAGLALGVAYLVLFGFGMYMALHHSSIPFDRMPGLRRQVVAGMSVMGFYAVNWLMVVLTILMSVDTLAGEIATGTIQAVVSKPIRRWEVVLGKWLGFSAMLVLYLLILACGVTLETRLIGGAWPQALGRVGALMMLETLLLLSLSFRAGASLSTLASGVLVFGLHMLGFMGGWIEEIGALQHSQTTINVGVIASLLIPSESLWRRASFELQGAMQAGASGRTVFTISSVPSVWMIVYAGLYLVTAFALTLRRFSRRDL